jgi:segregation and condensation protein B
MEVAGGYQFRTKSELAPTIKQLAKNKTLALTPGMLEVLAIVAYRGPISRIEIDKVRGVDSSHMLRGLLDRKLIKMSGRSDDLGRPTLYATSKEFLEFFNLNDLSDLPPEQELLSLAANRKKISEIKQMIETPQSPLFDEYEELSHLGQTLREIKADTSFTRDLRLDKGQSTGFDILNKHISMKEVTDENLRAAKSDLIVPLQEPTILKLLTPSTQVHFLRPNPPNTEETV